MGYLLLEEPSAVCRVGLVAKALRVPLALLCKLSGMGFQKVTDVGHTEFTIPM